MKNTSAMQSHALHIFVIQTKSRSAFSRRSSSEELKIVDDRWLCKREKKKCCFASALLKTVA